MFRLVSIAAITLIISISCIIVFSSETKKNLTLWIQPSFQYILDQADATLDVDKIAIAHKTGFKGTTSNNYYSVGPYWWPNPNTFDGLPYIRKDGLINYEFYEKSDVHKLKTFSNNIESSALAYYYTRNPRYIEKIDRLLKIFFLEPSTKIRVRA
ncbi:alginate lyase family protein [Vibrio breoganii]|uniref:alginate lyase family protein n=1 Tax=Vibrio breoganii TaxID=553239 RepID=UPI000C865D72|nr:alginate lyase family protein [Vibrio breoganii]PML99988.1 hypothetical protein BCT64_18340 [Vibrio breoganii]PMN70148.1 hypothetical protein BCT28_18045 [Vibrio breoganii]